VLNDDNNLIVRIQNVYFMIEVLNTGEFAIGAVSPVLVHIHN